MNSAPLKVERSASARLRSGRYDQGATGRASWVARVASAPSAPAVFGLVALFVVYVILQPKTLSSFGLTTVSDEYTAAALAAVGEGIVVLTGGLDLSVGAVMALVNVILAANLSSLGGGGYWLIPAVIAISVGAGFVNGILVVWARLPSIIATIAMLFVWQGVALVVLPQPGGNVPLGLVTGLTGAIGNTVPTALIILAVLAVICWYALRTRFGIALLTMGSSREVAHIVGLKTRRLTLAAFMLAGLLYGLAGVFLTAQAGSGDPNIGSSFLLESFAAVAVGGTLFGGGRGSLLGCVVGALLLGIITNVLFVFQVSSFITPAFYGLVLFVTVVMGNPRWRTALVSAWRAARKPSDQAVGGAATTRELR